MEAKHEGGFKIVVNGQLKDWPKSRITFAELVELAFPGKPGKDYTITYSKGPKENPSGSLLPGESVEVKNHMVFDVVSTVKS